MGRPSIFHPKDSGERISILALTTKGRQMFERARVRLQKLAKWPGRVGDADVVETLLRGDAETARYLARKLKGD